MRAPRVGLIWIGWLVSCGRNGFELHDAHTGDSGDAPTEDASTCAFGPFAAPVPLPGPVNSSVDDWTPSLSASGLVLLFYSQRASLPGEPDIWVSTRTSTSALFSAGSVITEVSSTSRDESPHLTADELEMFFTSDRGAGNTMFDIYRATRASTSVPFDAPAKVVELSSSFDEDTVWISRDGLRMMFSSSRGSSYDLYVASRPDRTSTFGAAAIVTELSTLSIEGSPALTTDELEIFFVSNRSGGAGKYDVWHATRSDRTTPFVTPVNVLAVNSAEDEWGLALSPDGRELYYSYSATLAGGNADIWVATRACL